MIAVAIDQAHKERGNLTTNFKTLNDILTENGYTCYSYAEFPIARNNLAPFDILVLACPDNAKFSKQEIETIVNWVKNEGGGLLMLSHAGGDKGRRSNLSELGEQFGIIFENDQVLDKVNNMGVENLPVITNFGFPHPITEDVSSICYRAGCSLTVASMSVTPVVSSSPDAEPVESPLVLSTEIGEGRVVAIGSYEMFRDKIGGGIKEGSHTQLLLNIFNWLKTSKREELKTQEGVTTTSPAMNSVENNVIATDSGNQAVPPQYTNIPLKSYKSDVKIISNAELFKAFEDILTEFFSFKERMLKEFDNLQNNLSNLLGAVIATEEDIVNISTPKPPSESLNLTPPPSNKQVKNLHVYDSNQEFDIADTNESVSSSNAGLTKNIGVASDAISEETQKQSESETKLVKTKEEIEAELESLENKQKSIKNLSAFVEKKYSSGKLSKKNYDKQIKKLTSDLKKTQIKIDDLNDELKSLK